MSARAATPSHSQKPWPGILDTDARIVNMSLERTWQIPCSICCLPSYALSEGRIVITAMPPNGSVVGGFSQ